jgi:hypothetical protein
MAPTQKQVSPQLWDETVRGHGLNSGLYASDLPNRRFAEYARSEGLPLIDLLPVLRAGHEGIYENEHWNSAGHVVVAEAIAAALFPQG